MIGFHVSAQNLMTVGKENVTIDEFKKIYQKNNNAKASYSQKDISEYLDLFTLYKMKLQEAREKRIDTLSALKDDYQKYTDQLVQNTVVDKNYVENLLKAQYEHTKFDVKVAHIMVKCTQNASAQDTALAYNKLKFIRDKTTKDNFASQAKENSEDKASSVNGGLLGYITAFMTFPDFEDQCYSTPVGQLSPIFRTQFGYHFLLIMDKRPARGRVKVAHIFMKKADDKSDEKKMNEAYAQIMSKKMNFNEAVQKYSEDASTKDKNGELPDFGVSEMVQDFEDQSFSLKNIGDISKPFKSEYGWHMVKLIEKKPVQTYELSKDFIKQKMERDPRLTNLRMVAYEQLAKKYNLQENKAVYDNFSKFLVDTFFMQKKWVLNYDKSNKSQVLFSFDSKPYSVEQFVNFANQNFNTASSRNKNDILKAMYDAYRERNVWEASKLKLQKENEDYRNLESEYMNGLLIFEIMDREIWKKAVLDTNGAKKVYEKVKNDYWYKDRASLEGLKSKNKELIANLVNQLKNASAKNLMAQIKKTKDSNDVVYFERIIEKGDYPAIDEAMNKGANTTFSFEDEDKMSIAARLVNILPPSIKPYNDIKGRIQNLYQNQIESEWNSYLRKKYPVQINQAELSKLIKN